MMYGQMTAGSWIYIGTQGIVQGTYETFAEAGRQHYDGDLKGKWILTGGLGGMGGAQPLAAVMAGACCLAVECDETRIDFRLRTRYVDEKAHSLDEALGMIERGPRPARPSPWACSAMPQTSSSELAARMKARRPRPDIVTDQTSAHDPLMATCRGLERRRMAREAGERSGKAVEKAARASMKDHVGHGRFLERRRADTRLRQQHPPGGQDEGLENAFAFPGFVPAYIRPLFCRASARSAGARSRATRKTSTRPTPR
jgi:urocanate hydratase